MVRLNKDNKIRVSDNFLNFTNMLRKELQPERGRVTSRELTDDIASFIHRENLTPILLRQAKNKKKRRLF